MVRLDVSKSDKSSNRQNGGFAVNVGVAKK